jgi:hypothetical protein
MAGAAILAREAGGSNAPGIAVVIEQLKAFSFLKQRMNKPDDLPMFEDWLLEHGEEMGPNIKRPKGFRLGPMKQCYMNSTKKAMELYYRGEQEWFYCEGYVVSGKLPIPIAHAWLANRKGEVIDLTLRNYEPGELSYFGIPFQQRYVNETAFVTGYYGVFCPNGVMYNRELLGDSPAKFRAWEKGK